MKFYLNIEPLNPVNQKIEFYYYSTIIGIIIFNFMFYVQANLIIDPDIYWHIKVGDEILENLQFPLQDHYSHTYDQKPWIAKEWLSQVILAAAFSWAGWFGVVLLMATSLSLGFAILAHELMRKLSMPRVLILLAIAFLCLSPTIVPRPHLFALPVMMAWFAVLFRAAEAGRAPSLMAVPLITLWANLHSSFLFGLGFGGLLVVESVWRAAPSSRRSVFLSWAVFGLLSGLAALIHPYGVEVYLASKRVLDLGEALSLIKEWNASDFSSFSTMEALILFGIAAAFTTGYRLSLPRLGLLLLLLHMSLSHNRHLGLLGMLAPLLLAPSLALWDHQGDRSGVRPSIQKPVLLLGLAFTLATVTWSVFRPPQPIKIYAPEAALAAAQAAGLTGHVLNEYNFGGYLISRGIPTFIDGRTELFGGAFLKMTLGPSP